jgi:hypothetical protein
MSARAGNTVTHYVISAVLFIVALLARRIVTLLIFPMLRPARGENHHHPR